MVRSPNYLIAIIYGEDLETKYQSVIGKLNRMIEEFNTKEIREKELSIAYGHAIYTKDINYSLHDIERQAEKAMYECKHLMKVERN